MQTEEKQSEANLIDRRSDKRLAVNVPVEITDISTSGTQTPERTFIEDVSDFGCRFSTRGTVQKGDRVIVQTLGPHGKAVPSEDPRLFEVIWVSRKSNGWTVGAKILQGDKPTNIKFSPEHTTPKPPTK